MSIDKFATKEQVKLALQKIVRGSAHAVKLNRGFSSTERKIGFAPNGKPLYRLDFRNTNQNSYRINLSTTVSLLGANVADDVFNLLVDFGSSSDIPSGTKNQRGGYLGEIQYQFSKSTGILTARTLGTDGRYFITHATIYYTKASD